jgi:3',5'-cyclic AMP phosphodiesterase CpdA
MKSKLPSQLPHDWSSQSSIISKIPSLTGNRTRLAVLSDLHVSLDGQGSWKVYHRTIERFATALSSASKRDLDAVLIPGDLTRDGKKKQFEAVFAELEKVSVPFACVPGNHDFSGENCPRRENAISTFVDTCADEPFPFLCRINDIDIIGLNSMNTRDHGVESGTVSQSQIDQLNIIIKDTKNPIVMLHHPLTNSWRTDTALNPEHFRLTNARDVVKILLSHDVPLVVSGHVHWPLVGSAGPLREIVSPAVCSYPQAYLLIDVTPKGTTVSMNLLPDTDIQLCAYQNLCEDRPLDGLYTRTAESNYLSSLFFDS